jgi:hypothetical protein
MARWLKRVARASGPFLYPHAKRELLRGNWLLVYFSDP